MDLTEHPQEHVEMTCSGQGQPPPVTVSSHHFLLLQSMAYWSVTIRSLSLATSCPLLEDLANGMISYGTGPPYFIGTIAIHSCDEGFTLEGSSERTCIQGVADGLEGIWTGTLPSCEGKYSHCNC